MELKVDLLLCDWNFEICKKVIKILGELYLRYFEYFKIELNCMYDLYIFFMQQQFLMKITDVVNLRALRLTASKKQY